MRNYCLAGIDRQLLLREMSGRLAVVDDESRLLTSDVFVETADTHLNASSQ